MTNYYVSKNGLNTNTGLSIEMSVLTIQKALDLCQPGDVIYIDSGYYSESITISKDNIRVLPYSNSNNVTLSSFDYLDDTQWVLHENGIYKYQLSNVLTLGKNDLYSDENILIEARWPKIDNPHIVNRSNSAITDDGYTDTSAPIDDKGGYAGYYIHNSLSTLPNLTGGNLLFVAGYEWWLRAGDILFHTGNKIDIKYKYEGGFGSNIDVLSKDDPFFIWNKYELITEDYDYFFDVVNKVIYIKSPIAPSGIKAKMRDKCISITSSGVTIQGLKVRGLVGVLGNGCTLKELDIQRAYKDYTLKTGLASVIIKGDSNKLENSYIYNSPFNTSVNISGTNHTVNNNVIYNTGGLQCNNSIGLTVSRNTVYNTHGIGISIMGKGSEYSYNHVYDIGNFCADIAGLNAWNSGDALGTVVKYNHVHDCISYRNLIGNHYGASGIRLDSGGAPLGCSNYKIHNNLVYNVSASGIAVWSLATTNERFGDAQIYVVNNTINGLLNAKGGVSGGLDGVLVRNNLATDLSAFPIGADIANNFFTRTSYTNNIKGNPDLRNYIPNLTSPLLNQSIEVNDIPFIPDIGWLGNEDKFIWGGAIEFSINNIEFFYEERLERVVLRTIRPGTSLDENTLLKVNGNEYPISGRSINRDNSINHFFNVIDKGNLSIEILINQTYTVLGQLDIPELFNNEISVEGNELVIRGGGYYTQESSLINYISTKSGVYNRYQTVLVDISNIENKDSIRVVNKIDNSNVSYWIEEIDSRLTNKVPIHLDMNTIKLNPEGLIDINITYDTQGTLPQPLIEDIYPDIKKVIDESSDIVWLKSFLLKDYIEGSSVNIWNTNDNKYSFTQSNPLYQPTYKSNSFNGWSGVYFDIDSLIGPSLGNDTYTLWIVYIPEASGQTYSRMLSAGTPKGNDYTNGIQSLATESIETLGNLAVYTNTYIGRDVDNLTIGSSYKSPNSSNFKGTILEVFITKGKTYDSSFRYIIRDLLGNKYKSLLSFDIRNLYNPLKVKVDNGLGDLREYTQVNYINGSEIRIPYDNLIGDYTFTVINPNGDEATISSLFNNPIAPYSVSINGVDYPSNSSYSLDTHDINSPLSLELIITNTSLTTPISLSNIITPDGFVLRNSPLTPIDVSTSISLLIDIDTTTSRNIDEILQFNLNEESYILHVDGLIVSPFLTLLDRDKSIVIPNSSLSITTKSSSFYLKNIGEGSLSITNLSISPPYSLSLSTPITLILNEEVEVIVTLDTSTPGIYSSPLIIESNDIDNPIYEVNLLVSLDEPIEVRYNSSVIVDNFIRLNPINHGQKGVFSIDIAHKGIVDLSIDELVIPSDIRLIEGNNGSISTISTFIFEVEGDIGNHVYPLDIRYNGIYIYPLSIELEVNPIPIVEVIYEGNDISNGLFTLDFNKINQGKEGIRTIRLMNKGDRALEIYDVLLPLNYLITTLIYPYLLGKDEYKDIDITFKNNNPMGLYEGNLSINTNDRLVSIGLKVEVIEALKAGIDVRVNGLDIGIDGVVDMGRYEEGYAQGGGIEISIENIGTDVLELNTLIIPEGYSLLNTFPTEVQVGQIEVFTVQLNPSLARGLYEGSIVFYTNTDPYEYRISIKSEVYIKELKVRKDGVDIAGGDIIYFPSLVKGDERVVYIEVENRGIGDISLLNIEVDSPFFTTSNGLIVVESNSRYLIDIRVNSGLLEAGEYNSLIRFNTDETYIKSYEYRVNALIYDAFGELTVEDSDDNVLTEGITNIEYLSSTVNTRVEKTFTLRNTGNINIRVDSIVTPEGYSLEGITLPLTLIPDGERNISIVFDIDIAGVYEGGVDISGVYGGGIHPEEEMVYAFYVRGEKYILLEPQMELVYKERVLGVNNEVIDFGIVGHEVGKIETIEVRSIGNEDIEITQIELGNGFIYVGKGLPLLIPPGSSELIEVQINTSVSGIYNTSCLIYSNSTISPNVNIGIKGRVITGRLKVRDENNTLIIDGHLIDYSTLYLYKEVSKKRIYIENIGEYEMWIEEILDENILPFSINRYDIYPYLLLPGREIYIDIEVDTNGNEGDYLKEIEIKNSLNRDMRIGIHGEIVAIPISNLVVDGIVNEVVSVDKDLIFSKEIWVSNQGSIPFTLESMMFKEGVFNINFNGVELPRRIGSRFNVRIEKSREDIGVFEDVLIVKDIEGNTREFPILLRVEGGVIEVADEVYMGKTYKDFPSLQKSVEMVNRGNIEVEIELFIEGKHSPFDIVVDRFTLGIGQVEEINLEFNTVETGVYESVIGIRGSKVIEKSVRVRGEIMAGVDRLIEMDRLIDIVPEVVSPLGIFNGTSNVIKVRSIRVDEGEIEVIDPILPIEIGANSFKIVDIRYKGEIEGEGLVRVEIEVGEVVREIYTEISITNRTRVEIGLGADDVIEIPIEEGNTEEIEVVEIGEGLEVRSVEGVEVSVGDVIDKRIRVRSNSEGIYDFGYKVGDRGRVIEMKIEAGVELEVEGGVEGYIPIEIGSNLYPVGVKSFREDGKLWVLSKGEGIKIEEGIGEGRRPDSLIVDVNTFKKEVEFKGGRALNIVKRRDKVMMVGRIDREEEIDVIVYFSRIPKEIMEINGVKVYRERIEIGGREYKYNLIPGVIKIGIRGGDIRVVNNGVTRAVIESGELWIEGIYRLGVDSSCKELIVGVDEDGGEIETYIKRKYSGFREVRLSTKR